MILAMSVTVMVASALAHMVTIETQRKEYCVKQLSLGIVSQGLAVDLSWHRMPVNTSSSWPMFRNRAP